MQGSLCPEPVTHPVHTSVPHDVQHFMQGGGALACVERDLVLLLLAAHTPGALRKERVRPCTQCTQRQKHRSLLAREGVHAC